MHNRLLVTCIIALAAAACGEGNSSEANHFRMRVDGELLEADTNTTIYFVNDSGLAIAGTGGTVVYCTIQLSGITQAGTFPIHGDPVEEGLRYQDTDSIYYIDQTRGTGTLVLEERDYDPGMINRLKGTFSGTAATGNGHSISITEGSFSYTAP